MKDTKTFTPDVYAVEYVDEAGFKWSLTSVHYESGQGLSEFTRDDLEDDLQAGRITIKTIKRIKGGRPCIISTF